MAWVAGVVGCTQGWIAVTQDTEALEVNSLHVLEIAHFLQSPDAPEVVAINVPIGLAEHGLRECDVQARRLLQKRKLSLSYVPPREALSAPTREAADEISKRLGAKGISEQMFRAYNEARELMSLLRSRPDLGKNLFEVHPELSFQMLNSAEPLVHPKNTLDGPAERTALVESYFGSAAFQDVRARHPRRFVGTDSILDAFSALWTAGRIHAGRAGSCPFEPTFDSDGRRMAIWY